MFFCSPISSVQKKACTSFPQMSFLHMVWIKILFPVQAFPLSGYRFPICLCLKYCPQKIICRCDPLRPGTEKSGHRYSGIRLRHCSGHLRAYHLSAACCFGFPHIQLHSHRSRRDCSKKYILTEFIRNFQSTVSETQRKCRFFFSQRRQIL